MVNKMIEDVTEKTRFEKDKLSNIVEATKSRIQILTALEEKRKDLEMERQNVDLFNDVKILQEDISEIEIGDLPPLPSIDYKHVMHEINLDGYFGTYSFRLPQRNTFEEYDLMLTHDGSISYVGRNTKIVICSQPLPEGVEMIRNKHGRPFFIDHNAQITRLGIALQKGWEMMFTPEGKPYYVNHKTKKTTWTYPRQQIEN
ncbi:unnamed protein product [Mytilus coruscus]|uniref:WW domain-containing protein n=1 Tax=Mytilus coruscus TaxID=42192 RepID=A0A6J8BAN2_MYTCO|nr:unnamed protein product [Mytilus coruscus]